MNQRDEELLALAVAQWKKLAQWKRRATDGTAK